MQCLFLGGIESNGIQCMFENSILPIKTNIFLWIKETKGELTKNLKLINGLTKLQYHFTVFSFFLFLLSSSAQQTSAYWKLQHFQPRWRNMERLLRFMNRFAFWQVPDCIPAIWKLCASKVFIRPYKPKLYNLKINLPDLYSNSKISV